MTFVLAISNLLILDWADASLVMYFIAFFYVGAFLFALYRWENINKICELGRSLFFSRFGVQPDNVEYLFKRPLKFCRMTFGLLGPTCELRFFLKGKELRGVLNREEETLHMNDPIHMPVYTSESIPVWKEITKMYDSGIPKKIEYYDDMRALIGVDFLDANGTLMKKSWRREEGVLKRWDMETEEWVPRKL
ncbi:MAG: hypothetical protein HXS53_04555 [Theionarchaea archaeon]|nr:hypothetical protein [Theionarchaea archaeon]